MAWLQQLPRHPIFTLFPPPALLDDSAPSPQRAQPATPARQSLFPSTRTPATLSQSASSRSLFGRDSPSSPSIFKRSSRPSSTPSKNGKGASGAAGMGEEGPVKGGRKNRMVTVRGSEVVLAVGKELRMASLADVKARCPGDAGDEELDEDVELGEYKTLSTPTINFEIQQLVLNSTSKLLAVVGAQCVVVVVLPRKGWATSVGQVLECRSLSVGAFYHSLPGSPLVAQALWHPWGEHASSLLVLTADSTLREYTISDNVEEPAQTVSLAKKAEGGGKGGFSAEDKNASRAVAMCLGEGKGDWGPLTLYALMRNGDVASLCPFLPKKASVPPSYIHSLAAFVSAKVDFLAASEAASSALTRFDPSASTSSALATTSKALSRTIRASTPSFPAPPHTPAAFSKRYNLQQQYVHSLVRQTSTASSSFRAPSALEPEASLAGDAEEEDLDEPVRVVLPSRSDFTPSLQGPFLLQPAPAELGNGAASLACDLSYLSYSSFSSTTRKAGKGGEASVGVLAVSYSDGKVDLCVEVEKVEARWEAEKDAARQRVGPGAVVLAKRKGGYGVNADSDEEEGETDEEVDDIPTLAVWESIDLGLAAELNPSGGEKGEKGVARGLAENFPSFVRDPLYPDTLYVRHALGAHCILLGGWLEGLIEVVQEGEAEGEKAVREAEGKVKEQKGSEVLWVLKTLSSAAAGEDGGENAPPLVALEVVNDVYLGYSLLLLTSSLQLVGVELALRVDPAASGLELPSSLPSSSSAPTSSAVPSASPAYTSLLSTPFTIPTALSSPKPLPRLPLDQANKGPLSITPSTLRALGTHVSQVQTSVRELASAADEVQHRLELQMKELARQLEKLSELKQLRSDLGKSVSAATGGGAGGTEGRLQRVEAKQRALIERTDRVLQRLIEQHQPEVSTYERKWFDELARLEVQVHGSPEDGEEGGGTGGKESLETRARRVEAMVEALRPAMEEIKRREKEGMGGGGGRGTPRREGLGGQQVKQLEAKLAEEAKLLADAKRKVERLTSSLAATSLTA
ncbi:hypothetical protein JCM8547_003105 [Rhodosporidiobolus lusitaniae]